MRAIETLAKQIRAQQFNLDATRSGRWLSSPSVQTSHMAEPQVPDIARRKVTLGVQVTLVAVHLRSGVTHRVLDGGCTFACGRQRSLNYEEGPLETSEGA
eukprot:108613-Amphidinium_carterae.1